MPFCRGRARPSSKPRPTRWEDVMKGCIPGKQHCSTATLGFLHKLKLHNWRNCPGMKASQGIKQDIFRRFHGGLIGGHSVSYRITVEPGASNYGPLVSPLVSSCVVVFPARLWDDGNCGLSGAWIRQPRRSRPPPSSSPSLQAWREGRLVPDCHDVNPEGI